MSVSDDLKKYTVCIFPSYLGSPEQFNSYILCKIYAFDGYAEVRTTNNRTQEDTVL